MLFRLHRPGERRRPIPVSQAAHTVEVLLRSPEPDHDLAPTSEHRCGNDDCPVRGIVVRLTLAPDDAPPSLRCPCCSSPMEFVSHLRRGRFTPVKRKDGSR